MILYVQFIEPVYVNGHGTVKRYSFDADASTITVNLEGGVFVLVSKKDAGKGRPSRVPMTNVAFWYTEAPKATKGEAVKA